LPETIEIAEAPHWQFWNRGFAYAGETLAGKVGKLARRGGVRHDLLLSRSWLGLCLVPDL